MREMKLCAAPCRQLAHGWEKMPISRMHGPLLLPGLAVQFVRAMGGRLLLSSRGRWNGSSSSSCSERVCTRSKAMSKSCNI